MKVHHGTEDFSAIHPVITIGMFDGVHRGHTSVLEYVRQKALKLGGESVVLSFWPHPRVCFEGDTTKLRYITTLEEKISLLEKTGIDHLVVQPFTCPFAALSPEKYVQSVLVAGMKAHTVIVGYDHNFGHKGAGNFSLLQDLGKRQGFSVQQLPPLSEGNVNISSTKIRNALYSGDIETANHYLAYNYRLTGIVSHGAKLGRTIGFPTANIEIENQLKLVPHNGVYVISGEIDGITYNGVMNIGTRPTVDTSTKKTLEAYFFDFSGDIYGKKLTIHFHTKIREELKFDNLDALKRQIQADVERGKNYFR